MKAFLEAGEFVTTHAITGELRLYPWSDSPEFLEGFARFFLDAAGKKELVVERIRRHKNICIVKLDGINSIEEARRFIGRTVYIAREDVELEEGWHFVQDLLGAEVKDADTGAVYGTIANITHPGRHDVYEVAMGNGQMALFPAVEPFLISSDPEAGRVLVRPIPGMFDEGAAAGTEGEA